MSVESYLRAMPKAELGLQLEGAVPRQTLTLLASRNDIPSALRAYNDLLKQFDKPDYPKLSELIATISQWVKYPDDLSRLVYDVGVALSRQNVRYAEIGVNPLTYINHTGMSFEQFIEALNDGRDRALRGWKVKMQWVLNIPREDPRRGDDIARWALSATARKNGVIGLGLVGREDAQPAGQFERPFRSADKKAFPRVVHAGDKLGAAGMLDALDVLSPTQVIGGWGTADAPDVIGRLVDRGVVLTVAMARQLCMGQVGSYQDYPLRWLYDQDVKLTLTAHMPEYYKTTLSDEYLALVEHNGFSLEELEELALNAVRYSQLDATEQNALLATFKAEYDRLREEHLAEVTPE